MAVEQQMEPSTKSDEHQEQFRNGVEVTTCLGEGEVVGKESFYGGKLVRYLVRLKDPSRWSLGNKTDVAAFFKHELSVL